MSWVRGKLLVLESDSAGHKVYEQSEDMFQAHLSIFKRIGDILLRSSRKTFEIDKYNESTIRLLIAHVNGWETGSEYHDTRKNLLVVGKPGCGKTLLMQVLSEFIKILKLPFPFINTSMTEVMNYQKVNSHIDYFTFNTEHSKGYQSKPFGICINDLGIGTERQKSFGTELSVVTDELLFARYEIYQQKGIPYHITTNLDLDDFKNRFGDRLLDRFSSFNVIHLMGGSRR